MNTSILFKDSENEDCSAVYNSVQDLFIVRRFNNPDKEVLHYHPDEVEDFLSRGIWKRCS